MGTNRKVWFKQLGLGLAGIGLANIKSVASPAIPMFINGFGGDHNPILLSSNENPYGPSPLVRKALADNLTISNRYN